MSVHTTNHTIMKTQAHMWQHARFWHVHVYEHLCTYWMCWYALQSDWIEHLGIHRFHWKNKPNPLETQTISMPTISMSTISYVMHCEMHDTMQQSNCFNLYAHQCAQYNVNMGLLYLNMGLLYHNWGCYTYNYTISTLYRPQVKA